MTETQAFDHASGTVGRWPRILVLSLAAWMVIVSGLVLALNWGNPVGRAILGMAWGLIVLWVGGCGLAMWRWRDFWCRLAGRIRLPWMLKFVLGRTLLAVVVPFLFLPLLAVLAPWLWLTPKHPPIHF